ncbi:hypothetical protein AB0E08_29890 [Streptomyces sp. NPDC048281]|uniref:hypothetical protein n=1 Tax=Streptomyces sp. NPDC048281 TaxID=3154715 RepID=UPI00344776E9
MADPAVPDGWVLAYRGLTLTVSFIHAQGRDAATVITSPRDLLAGPNTAALRDGLPAGTLAGTLPAAVPGPSVPGGQRPTTHRKD